MDRTWVYQRAKMAMSNWKVIVMLVITLLFILQSWPSSPISHASLVVNEYIEHRMVEMKVNQEGTLASRVLVDLIFGNARQG
ncbi:hypothetical protein RJ45_01190 [Photobacterium gaetbulicola]|uniref:Uncharacterized protein n=1 Tax=Photobacterium gaetbulicola TaxID=1295392 RepID=A0A0B9H970_9GAMM|nr:hypothetical protein [Photobacterium gaetbulicola]KHT65417.1 hypothetical protein RJ45_01190 [Photobacterium gaetbulicola]